MSDILTPQRVLAIADDCNGVYVAPEDARSVRVEGVVRTFAFDRWALDRHAAEIRAMLAELPRQFRQNGGEDAGGWSFLNGCMTESGEWWTGDQAVVELLFALGMAIGAVACLMPREMWSVLPGGVPYFMVLDGVQ